MRRWVLIGAVALSGLPGVAWASEADAILNKLVEKGILTASEAQEVRNEVNPELTKQEDRLTKLEKSLDEKTTMPVGKGTLKMGGLFQGWAVYDARTANGRDRFQIRRAELKFAGDILGDDRFKYAIMVDPVQAQEDNTRKSVLQDAYFLLDHLPALPNHTLTLGQFKAPRTEEGTRSSSQLDFAERTMVTKTFGDQRDLGAMLTGTWPLTTYQLGVFNGKQNQAPKHDQKSLVGRLVLRPLKLAESVMELPKLGELELGISGEHRPHGDIVLPKKRLGYEARYAYQNLSLKGEYYTGEDTTSASSTSENNAVGKGWYTQAGYLLAPWFPKAQVLARFEGWDPNGHTALDAERDLTLGFNYFIDKHNAKWQLNWVHQTKQTGKIDNQVISALQYAF
ncbi:MAG: hypothetical protein HYZ89_05700 [Candidatus Omnitrophica bacterium]|nr:hypothetical protein [Candidatus Omnitrophota bacterium]